MAPARKDLTAAKFALLEAMAADRRLTALDHSVSILLLSRYLNRNSNDAWPSPERLAAELHVAQRSVYRSLKRLCDREWWQQTKKGGGAGRTSHYSPEWKTVTYVSGFEHSQTVTGMSTNSDTPVRQTVTGGSGEPFDRNPCINPLKERSDSQNLDKGFKEPTAPPKKAGGDGVNGSGLLARQQSEHAIKDIDIDWDRWVDWFRVESQFEKRNGYGAGCFAGEIIEKLRSAAGDQAALNCLRSAQEKRFFGEPLEKHVESRTTWHEKQAGRSK
jgi:hypothetical protein